MRTLVLVKECNILEGAPCYRMPWHLRRKTGIAASTTSNINIESYLRNASTRRDEVQIKLQCLGISRG